MPTLSVNRDALFRNLKREYTDKDFDELCFQFGVELDEITSERLEAEKSSTVPLSRKQLASLDESVVYKIDVPANRYDLLCMEGLVRAVRIFLGDAEAPTYDITSPERTLTMTVKPDTAKIRPFVVCAVLRNVTFNEERYHSFIDLQDQLHRNLCRGRTLVAIGTHDLESVKGPDFVYDAKPPDAISFVPLTEGDEKTGRLFKSSKELLDHYATDPACKHLKPYGPIIADSPVHPVVLDSENSVMSLPPVINGAKSKITLDTKHVFIECTATDLTKANIVLDTVVAMFSEHCAQPFSVEPVKVLYVDEQNKEIDSYVTPKMFTRNEKAKVSFVNSLVGIDLDPEAMVKLCNKVQLGPAKIDADGEHLVVTVPPTRSDILHAVDIAEDVGIAFGYDNIRKRIPSVSVVGGERPLNKIGDSLRFEIAGAGYTEILTHGLCSLEDNFTNLRRPVGPAVSLSNPANVEYEVVRTSLLPGLLKTLQHNRSASFSNGFKIFEISDVVLPDDGATAANSVVGARNARRVCAVYAGPTSGFEIVHGLVDRIMTLCEVAPEKEYVEFDADHKAEEEYRVAREGWYYTIQERRNEEEYKDGEGEGEGTFFPGRAADVLLTSPALGKRVNVGSFGILHPEVLENFDINYPASCVEIDLEALL